MCRSLSELIVSFRFRAEQQVIEWFGRDKRAIGFMNEFRSKRRKLQAKSPAELIRPESQIGVSKEEEEEEEG